MELDLKFLVHEEQREETIGTQKNFVQGKREMGRWAEKKSVQVKRRIKKGE